MLTQRLTFAVFFASGALILAGCSRKAEIEAFDASPVPTKATRRVTLRDVQPIFSTKCTSCHNPAGMDEGVPLGGLVLLSGQAAGNLLNTPSIESKLLRVAPGNPAKSYLHHKLHGTFAMVGGVGGQMPLGGKLEPDELALIDDWILSGAPLE